MEFLLLNVRLFISVFLILYDGRKEIEKGRGRERREEGGKERRVSEKWRESERERVREIERG